MQTSETRWIRHAILPALFLLGCAALAFLYVDESVPISRERNASVLKNVFEVFDPSLIPFLASVPIVLDASANTAKAYPAKGYIAVSPDWDHAVQQSKYRTTYEQRGLKPGDAVFTPGFKTVLLIHEFLHVLQVRQGIDSRSSYETIARWYADPAYGVPAPATTVDAARSQDEAIRPLATNRLKYVVWHNLYNTQQSADVPPDGSWRQTQYAKRYRSAEKGVEEFAYVGTEILAGGSDSGTYAKTGRWSDGDWSNKKTRLAEISPAVIALYQGVFNPALLR